MSQAENTVRQQTGRGPKMDIYCADPFGWTRAFDKSHKTTLLMNSGPRVFSTSWSIDAYVMMTLYGILFGYSGHLILLPVSLPPFNHAYFISIKKMFITQRADTGDCYGPCARCVSIRSEYAARQAGEGASSTKTVHGSQMDSNWQGLK
jgi:hypothetical protein